MTAKIRITRKETSPNMGEAHRTLTRKVPGEQSKHNFKFRHKWTYIQFHGHLETEKNHTRLHLAKLIPGFKFKRDSITDKLINKDRPLRSSRTLISECSSNTAPLAPLRACRCGYLRSADHAVYQSCKIPDSPMALRQEFCTSWKDQKLSCSSGN